MSPFGKECRRTERGRRMRVPTVWVTKDDGSDISRADAIAGVGSDYNGSITARLAGSEGSAVTLVAPGHAGRPAPAH